MNKKIVGISVMMLFIITSVLPVLGAINEPYLKESNTNEIKQITGISFYQISYYWTESNYIHSNTGYLIVDIETVKKETGLDSGYINVYSPQGWIVANLPFFMDFGYPRIKTFFDLGKTGECTSINVHAEATAEPYAAFTYSGALTPYPVVATSYNADGGDDEPTSSRKLQPPLPSLPEDFDEVGNIIVYTQKNHPNVQVADMQCVPAAYANNLQYLENEFGTPVEDELIRGRNGEPGLPGQLDVYMQRESISWTYGNGTNYSKALNGFLKYAYFKDLAITVRHQGLNGSEDFNYLDFTSEGQGKTISIDYILDEMKVYNAVALLFWRYTNGQHKGGHMVQLTSAGRILNRSFIMYLDDIPQGDLPLTEPIRTPFFTWLKDTDNDGKLNLEQKTGYDGPPEAELLVILEADNQPPDKPSMPLGGKLTMKTGVEYEFTTSTIDPDGHQIWYLFDWGDGTKTGWIGPYTSGNTASASHIWSIEGIYAIKVKARDYYGAESEWSDERWGILPIIKPYLNTFFLQFLENHPHMYPILRQLLGV